MTPLLRLLVRAGWAPLLVLLFHQWLLRSPYRQQLDFVMHCSGGVAITFFLWHTLDCFAHWFGRLSILARYLFTFALACTVGLFWEFAEFFSDVVYGTHIQYNVRETMRDLIADATGALTTLTLTCLVRCLTTKRDSTADQPPASQV